MNILVTVDERWGIGNYDKLLVQIPKNQKLFIEETAGKVVVVGRKALQTFPQGMPLQGRTTIVLSKKSDLKIKGATVLSSVEALLKELKKYPDKDIYVAGGESVYEQLLPYCNVVHVTKIDRAYAANKYFPNLDKDPEWKITAESDEQTYFDIAYEFLKYERKK
jgi:dihydrofolate reductase